MTAGITAAIRVVTTEVVIPTDTVVVGEVVGVAVAEVVGADEVASQAVEADAEMYDSKHKQVIGQA